MSDDEARDSCLERTSFPLFHPKKSKMLSRGGERRMDYYNMGNEEAMRVGGGGGGPEESDAIRRISPEAVPSSSSAQISGGDNSGSSGMNPFVMNPLLAMGFQLPQLSLLMQQQQTQHPHQQQAEQHHHHQQQQTLQDHLEKQLPQQQHLQQQEQQQQQQHMNQTNLNLPSSSASSPIINPLLLPHMLTTPPLGTELATQQKAWPQFRTSENIPTLHANPEPRTGTIMSTSVNSNAVPRLSVKGFRDKQPIVAQKDDTGPGKQPFVCDLCREWFFSREKLVMHLVMNHSMQHCRFCSELFESGEMREEHELSVHLPLECDMCQASLPSPETLSDHYLLGHDVRNCQFCGVLVRPKSYYAVHVRRKHFVAPDVMVEEGRVKIVRRWDVGTNGSSAWTFTCHLCGKERKRTETFGHFYSYHRLSLLCLIQLLASEGVVFSVQGTPAPSSSSNVQSSLPTSAECMSASGVGDESSNNDASRNSGTSVSGDDSQQNRHRSSSSSSCTVCTNPFSVQVPKPAHDLFCRGLTLCRFCDRTFTSKAARNSHSSKDHGEFMCRVGCPADVTFTQEYELCAHYLQDHDLHMCHYCNSLVPTAHNQFTQHLRTVHNCTENSSALEDFGSGIGIDLFQCKYIGNILSVSCSLCNADITSFMKDINSLFKHLEYHNIGLPSALHLLETNLIFDTDLCVKKDKSKRSYEQDFRDFELSGGTSSLWESLLPTEADVQSIKARKSRMSAKKGSSSNARKVNYFSDQELSMMASTGEDGGGRSKSVIMKSYNSGRGERDSDCPTSRGNKKHSKDSDLKEKNGEKHNAGKSADDPNFDSSSDLLSSEDEDLCPSEVEGGENDLTEEDDEEYTPTCDRKSKQSKANLEADSTEAEFDPGEVECVFTDTSDEECEEEKSGEGGGGGLHTKLEIKQEPEDVNSSNTLRRQLEGRDLAVVLQSQGEGFPRQLTEGEDLVERTMKEIFGEERNQDTQNSGDQGLSIKREPEERQGEEPRRTEDECYGQQAAIIRLSDLNPKSMSCEICQGKFLAEEGPRELARHMSSLHGFSLRPYRGRQEDSKPLHSLNCPFCLVRATSRPALRQHIFRVHTTEMSLETPVQNLAYSCRHCKSLFWRIADRNEHQVQVHSDQLLTYFKCYVCLKVFSSKICLNRHMRIDHSGLMPYTPMAYKCMLCLVMLPGLSLLRQHFREQHPASLVFHCYRCNTTLKTKKTLRSHIKNVHSEARRRDCNLCGKVLWSKRAHAIHYRMKHSAQSKVGFRCRICQKRFDSKDERKLHYQVDHEGESPYHCSECGKGFASKSGMYGHRQLHTGSGVSKCEYCGKEFTRKDSYNEHLLIHNGPRHKCPHCPKEFVQRSNLVRHIRIHTGEKPYKCLYCEKCFSDKGACNSHIRVHTREETCSCPYCGQTFSKKQKLKYHIRKHTGEGLISCEICSKSFTNSFALKEHRVIHNRQTQILCQQCGKGFNSEKYLQRHVAIVHEPSNAFACPLCPKVFSQHARLKAHLMTHTGVKHIKCLLCEKAYSVRKSLRRHLLEKHQISPEHPQYKHCFYAMTAEEAGLRIPEGAGPYVPDDDSTSQSFSKDEEVKKKLKQKKKEPVATARKYPRKAPGRKGPARRGISKTSAPFEVYGPAGAGEQEGSTPEVRKTRRKYATRKSTGALKPPEAVLEASEVPDVSPSPSTSTGDGGKLRGKASRQKVSPRKVMKKDTTEEEEEEEEEESTEHIPSEDSSSSSPESVPSQGPVPSPPKKRSPGRPKKEPTAQQQQQIASIQASLSASPSKVKKAQTAAATSGRKKRRVEAIVEILQKTGSSPSSGSTKEEEEEEEEVEERVPKEEEEKKEVSEVSTIKEESESDNDKPILAKILPLNSPKKIDPGTPEVQPSGSGRRKRGSMTPVMPGRIIVRGRTPSSKSDEDLS